MRHDRVLRLDVEGSFDFYTTIISLDALDFAAVARMRERHEARIRNGTRLSVEEFHEVDKALPLMAHELTHFLDSTSTLWGLRHLCLLAAAHRASQRSNEADFHHLKRLYDHVRALRLPDYYTAQGPGRSEGLPWRASTSVGRRFRGDGHIDTRTSITFTRFEDAWGELIVRSPISLVSLLETSAMSQETWLRVGLLDQLDPVARSVERVLLSRRTMDYLYNRAITEYSVCAHLVANHLRCSDGLAAFAIAGRLSRWVLDFPLRGYEYIADRASIGRIFGIDEGHAYALAVRDGLRGQDLGTLFSVMCKALRPGAHENMAVIAEAISAAGAALGLNEDTLRTWSDGERESAVQEITSSSSAILRRIAVAGLENHARCRTNALLLNLADLDFPQAAFGDGTSGFAGGRHDGTLAEMTVDECFDDLYPVERSVRNFAEACL